MIEPGSRMKKLVCDRCGRAFPVIRVDPYNNRQQKSDMTIRRGYPKRHDKADGSSWTSWSVETNYTAKLCDRCAKIAAVLLDRWVKKGVEK